MCYCCATNPSIHHHHRHVMAVSSPLSHHGVTFTSVAVSSLSSRCRLHHHIVTVSSSQLRHCGAFAVALLWFRHRHCGVAFIVALLRCCCHSFIIAIVVLPSRQSQFRHCHRGVAFIIASLQCRRHSRIVAVPSLLLHRCSFVIAVAVSPSSLHHHGVIMAIYCYCHGVVIAVSSSPCSVIVAVTSLRGCGYGCGHGRIVVVVIMVVVVVTL